MARLLNPGLGDYLDRLSILALKILHGQQDGKDVDHFIRERNAILVKVRAESSVEPASYMEGYSQLAAVNAALWHATDQMRIFHTDPSAGEAIEIARCGLTILTLNDARARLVQQLSEGAGDKHGPEKL